MYPATHMQKYLYKAQAIALRGSIRKPYYQELGDHLAISTYAGSASRIECTSRGFAVAEDIRYEVARTEIVTEAKNGFFTTSLLAQVEGLQIGKLSVDQVTCRLRSVYDSGAYPNRMVPRILPAGSSIVNLQFDKRALELVLPAAFRVDADTSESFFRGEHDDDDDALQPGSIAEPIHIDGFGTIFFAEWTWVHPQERHQQHLTMLRLALGSDLGANTCVGVGSSDGYPWPPISG
jgi:hypothetical protein